MCTKHKGSWAKQIYTKHKCAYMHLEYVQNMRPMKM
jgi:hypothetical protein